MLMNFTLTMLMILIMMILMLVMLIINIKMTFKFNKSAPFECGFDPFNKSRIPFSMHFYLITIIFLIFDIEISIILLMIMNFKVFNMIMFNLMYMSMMTTSPLDFLD